MLNEQTRARWGEISRGLTLVLAGQLVLGLLALAALVLVGLTRAGAPLSALPREANLQARPVLIALALVGTVAFLAYFCVLAGQVRCLAHAAQSHNGKELLYGSVFATLAGPVLSGVAPFLNTDTYVLLSRELERLGWLRAEAVLQLGGGALGLLGLFLFARFLQVVARCCQDRGLEERIEYHLLAGFLLLGGSVGMTFFTPHPAQQTPALLGLAAGWLACFLWHVLLISSTRRRLDQTLHHLVPGGRSGPHRVDGKTQGKPYSGLHYFYTARLP
jgi:hypothetical protein